LEGLERGAGSVRHDTDVVLSRGGGDTEVGYCGGYCVGQVDVALRPAQGPPAWAGTGCV
jgi:hypothetical protein